MAEGVLVGKLVKVVVAVLVAPLLVVALMMAGGGGGPRAAGAEDDASGLVAVGGPSGAHNFRAEIPEEYREVVARASRRCAEVTPGLLAAQVQTESGWDPHAGSPAGAQGISQFIPSTWATWGTDGDGDGVADVWNPVDAITSQAALMCDLVRQTRAMVASGTASGDVVELALAAYNAGPGAVLEAGGIPHNGETEAYVTRITALMGGGASGGGGGGQVDRVLAEARSKIGLPYVWGAAGPDSYDCSGLVQAAWRAGGVDLPHKAATQCSMGTPVDADQARPGDLVCWGGHHVALYVGGGMMVEAPDEGMVVRETAVYVMDGGPYYVRVAR